MNYWPQRRILLCTIGHSAGFGYVLWATGDFVMHYWPQRGYGYALWTTVQDFVMRYVLWPLLLKKCTYINSTNHGLCHPSFKSLLFAQKIGFLQCGSKSWGTLV